MRVLAACSLGGAGHLVPLLPFLDAARKRGHETLVVGPPGLARMVAETGHSFFSGGEPPETVVGPIREQLPMVAPRVASLLANRELFGRLATTAMLPAMDEVLPTWKPHLVLRDPCEYASAVVAWRLKIPTAQMAIGLADVERGSIEVAAPALEAHREGLVAQLMRSPYVTRFPASLDPSPFPDTRRFREELETPNDALPDWWAGSTAPLVYISFGTVLGYMTIAEQVYKTVLEAVSGLDARILLTVGRRFDPSSLGDLADNVHVEAWIDQSLVLRDAVLVVCHGGSGTTFAAVSAGIPVVVVPVFADQFINGARVSQFGAGVVVDTGNDVDGRRRPPNAVDVPRIRRAIQSAFTGSSYAASARRLAAEMRAAPRPDMILDDLLRAS